MEQQPSFATLLANHMRTMKMGAQTLGKEANIPKQTIEGWLDGKRPRDWRSVCKIARSLGLCRAQLDVLLLTAGHPSVDRLVHRCLGEHDSTLLKQWMDQEERQPDTAMPLGTAGKPAEPEVPIPITQVAASHQATILRPGLLWNARKLLYTLFCLVITLAIMAFWQIRITNSSRNWPNEMIQVPAGVFLQGSTPADIAQFLTLCAQAQAGCQPNDFDDELPQHQVTLPTFWIDRFEVTNEEFQEFVNATGYRTTSEKVGVSLVLGSNTPHFVAVEGADWRYPEGPATSIDDRMHSPVVHVSYEDAGAYCAWAGKRLPTEAEWEKAARGTNGRLFPWGSEWDWRRVHYTRTVTQTLIPTGARSVRSDELGRSPYGVADMLGNVAEWTADWYSPFYDVAMTNTQTLTRYSNPVLDRNYRVARGGGWGTRAGYLHVAWRRAYLPGTTTNSLGFRCANSS
jgi:formylglycine-generating enzyme